MKVAKSFNLEDGSTSSSIDVSWDTAFSIDNLEEAWDLCLGGGANTQVDPLVAIAPGATLAMLKNAMSDLRYSKNKPKEGG